MYYRPELTARLFLFVFVAIPIMLALGCVSLFAPNSYRYRMTIYVNTPAGVRAFSSVRQVSYKSDISFPNFSAEHQRREKGEAIPIESPSGLPYFALLESGDLGPEYVAIAAAQRTSNNGKTVKGDIGSISQYRGEYDLPRDVTRAQLTGGYYGKDDHIRMWPTIVSFSNASDPSSVHVVESDTIGIKRVTITITKDPVDDKIASFFPKDFAERWHALRPSFDSNLTVAERRRQAISWQSFHRD